MKAFLRATWSFVANLLWKLLVFILLSFYGAIVLGLIFPQFSEAVLAEVHDSGTQMELVNPDYYENSKGVSVKKVPSDDTKTWALIQKRKLTTCDELIKVWRPAHLTMDNVKVACMDELPATTNDRSKVNTKGVTRSLSPRSDFSTGPFVIELKRDTPVDLLMDVYSHEAFHVVSFSWPMKKQKDFIASLGETTWSNGSYRASANERWAWAATSCVAHSTKHGIDGNENDIPGGCKAVKKWLAK